MDEIVEIPVYYKGEHLCFTARVLSSSYNYKFLVTVFGCQLIFEADEEGKYRAVAQVADLPIEKKIDLDLLQAITQVIDAQIK